MAEWFKANDLKTTEWPNLPPQTVDASVTLYDLVSRKVTVKP